MTMSKTQLIKEKLQAYFQPSYLEVVNESHQHSVPPGSESHFKVTLVSEVFVGINQVKRHQTVYEVLKDEMKNIHALSLHTYTPEEWQEKEGAPLSPKCRGG